VNVLQILARSSTLNGFRRDLQRTRRFTHLVKRHFAIKSYLKGHQLHKLQLGSGPNRLTSWLSSDVAPESSDCIYLDVRRRFPFASDTFDYVFNEHMIEHLTFENGLFMLRECHRVLKAGGKLRIATPDLSVLMGLYSGTLDAAQARYVHWICERFIAGARETPVFVINNAFSNWGHEFLYDRETLEESMKSAGFHRISRVEPGQSDDAHLKGLESHGSSIGDEEINRFETMVLEAVA
jgi:predicted SAM-dependent methyltransferase